MIDKKCEYCGSERPHKGKCPLVKAYTYDTDGPALIAELEAYCEEYDYDDELETIITKYKHLLGGVKRVEFFEERQ